ncbi:hypothetical protein NQ015_04410 [Corynebacterium sp. 153RC1]|uniref:DUF6912 family protein n=1 Tax=Corynebacterium TaxID=1716 RepID=UPI00211BDD7E|nr:MULTISPECIES: hypothetical protein [unclassified Corynebacterium]MCQ9371560.1 hypothetical protein [Corynebacterium sp. 35RC1]MCQ9343099.1 hypothetical protein [Corynebacterium sp. 76QC2CO]MCQ9352114.1 hypothetical protein [Corynebacterium sp. 209RC1]MCQ9354116.1 hypothetical protein [Corynebacterium sp. 1222RC1]MCQ9356396.1 hypothetical protein [Corynebacterium sp. 122RC1]
MRVFIPATFDILAELAENGAFHARSGYGFAVTPALREFFTEGEDEELSEIAFDDAARASLRLLATGEAGRYPHRRVVISVDIDDSKVALYPDGGEAVVKLAEPEVKLAQLAAIHVDLEAAEEATAKAVELVDAADLGDEDAELAVGDALDNFMAWYDPSELAMLML